MPHQRRYVFGGQIGPFQLQIAESVEGKLGGQRMRALTGKGVRRLRRTQVFRIEIPVHQNFGVTQNERAVKIFRRFHLRHARKVLPEVVHKFALRRADDLFDGDSFHGAHRLAHLRHERLFIEHNGDGRERL